MTEISKMHKKSNKYISMVQKKIVLTLLRKEEFYYILCSYK